MVKGIERGESMRYTKNPVAEKAMSMASSSDDLAAAAAVFRRLGTQYSLN